jgi:hypothetical protein
MGVQEGRRARRARRGTRGSPHDSSSPQLDLWPALPASRKQAGDPKATPSLPLSAPTCYGPRVLKTSGAILPFPLAGPPSYTETVPPLLAIYRHSDGHAAGVEVIESHVSSVLVSRLR